jgi:hypothetical protein
MTRVAQTAAAFQTEHDDLPCPACGHGAQAHDTTAVRYCAATEVSGAVRGCLCLPDAVLTGVQPLSTTQPFR